MNINDADELESAIDQLCRDMMHYVDQFLEGYIWQRDHFTIHSSYNSPPPWNHYVPSNSFWGRLKWGDNIEDEWFATWLLLQLTKHFPVTSKVWDNDGQFLLIEAAYSLPRWMKPETTENRLWLHQGVIHLIPPSLLPLLPPPSSFSQRQNGAGESIFRKSTDDHASLLATSISIPPTHMSIHNASKKKSNATLDKQKRTYTQHMLHALSILRQHNSGGISKVDTDTCTSTKSTTPPSSTTIVAGARINEALYESRFHHFPEYSKQLMHQATAILPCRTAFILLKDPQLLAPAVEAFYYRDPGDVKAASLATVFPPEHLVRVNILSSKCLYAQLVLQRYAAPKKWPPLPSEKEDPVGHKDMLLGVKITAGFEMLMAKYDWQSKCIDGDHVNAKQRGESPSKSSDEESGEKKAVHRIAEILSEYSADESTARCSVSHLKALPSDSDCWLYEGHHEIEQELQKRSNEQEHHGKAAAAAAAGEGNGMGSLDFDPEVLSKKMERFLNAVSGVDGADIPPLDTTKYYEDMLSLLKDDDDDDDEWSDEGSSFYTNSYSSGEGEEDPDDPSSDEDDKEIRNIYSYHKPIDKEWYVATETDSDDEQLDHPDEMNQHFMANYDDILAQQLQGTTLDESFERHPTASDTLALDVEYNLVHNMLASYKEQHGMAGPASTMAALLGVDLPSPGKMLEKEEEEGEQDEAA